MESIEPTTTTSQRAVRITGWVWFAGILLILAGGFNLIHGFEAIDRKQYFSSHIVYSNLTFWGWVFLIWGALQLFAGIASVAGRMTGNYIGVMLAATASMLWFLMIFSAPGAAILGVTINILIVYGLTTGSEPEWTE